MGREPGRIARWRAVNIERADHVNGTGRLTVATRTVLVLLGAATIGVAAVAMFRHDGDVVPTALVLVGAVFAVLGGLGRQVDSVNLKEGGLTYSRWRDEVLAQKTPEEVLEAATSAPPPVQRRFETDIAVSRVTDRAYDDAVRTLLTEQFGGDVEVAGGRSQPDFIVRRGDKIVFVECAYTRSMGPLHRVLTKAITYGEKVTGIVYISPAAVTSEVENAMLAARKNGIALELAFWDGRDFQDARHITGSVEKILAR